MLKTGVGLVLFVVSGLPTLYAVGLVGRLMPPAAAPLAFAMVGIPWIILMMLGTQTLTEKLSKRWNR